MIQVPARNQTRRRFSILIPAFPFAAWLVLLMIRPGWSMKWEMVPLLPFLASPDVWIQSREAFVFLWLISIFGLGIYAWLVWLAVRNSEPLIAVVANIFLVGGSIAMAMFFVFSGMGSWSSG